MHHRTLGIYQTFEGSSLIAKVTIAREPNCYHSRLPNPLPLKKCQKQLTLATHSGHGIYQTYKLALYIYALRKLSNSYEYGTQENLLRMQGPDGGFHTGYDRAGTYAGTLENAETTSILIMALNSTSTFRLFPTLALPPWILYVFIGFAGAAVAAVIIVLMLETRRKGQGPVGPTA